jgi:hypothetical protein
VRACCKSGDLERALRSRTPTLRVAVVILDTEWDPDLVLAARDVKVSSELDGARGCNSGRVWTSQELRCV